MHVLFACLSLSASLEGNMSREIPVDDGQCEAWRSQKRG